MISVLSNMISVNTINPMLQMSTPIKNGIKIIQNIARNLPNRICHLLIELVKTSFMVPFVFSPDIELYEKAIQIKLIK